MLYGVGERVFVGVGHGQVGHVGTVLLYAEARLVVGNDGDGVSTVAGPFVVDILAGVVGHRSSVLRIARSVKVVGDVIRVVAHGDGGLDSTLLLRIGDGMDHGEVTCL